MNNNYIVKKAKDLTPEEMAKRKKLNKKLFIFIGIIVGLIAIGNITGSDDKTTTQHTDQPEKIKESGIVADTMTLTTKLKNNIKSLEGADNIAGKVESASDINIAVALMESYSDIIEEGKQSNLKEDKELALQVEKRIVAVKAASFPTLRKAYFKLIKDMLWENDVNVTLSGKGNTTMMLTGVYFAANKNIKIIQESLSEMVTKLRFKQINYKWSKYDDEYQYYTLETKKDNEL